MQQCAATLSKGRNLRALEIDLAIERHQNLHSLQLLIPRGEGEALVHELVGKVFDGVGKDFNRSSGPGGNAAAAGAYTGGGDGRRRGRNREAGGRGGCHVFILTLFFGSLRRFFRLRRYPFPNDEQAIMSYSFGN